MQKKKCGTRAFCTEQIKTKESVKTTTQHSENNLLVKQVNMNANVSIEIEFVRAVLV